MFKKATMILAALLLGTSLVTTEALARGGDMGGDHYRRDYGYGDNAPGDSTCSVWGMPWPCGPQ